MLAHDAMTGHIGDFPQKDEHRAAFKWVFSRSLRRWGETNQRVFSRLFHLASIAFNSAFGQERKF